jgi:dolichol-phosphate mannosyltransferase
MMSEIDPPQSWEDAPSLSFVAPVYDEEGNVVPLCQRIRETCAEASIPDYEIILVENGSRDRSAELIIGLHRQDSRVTMVQLSRNYGYQGAIAAGLRYARGEWVVVLDSDQQDPPEMIPKMLAKAEEGYEVVYGIREKRRETLFRRVMFSLFYRVWHMMSNIDVPLDAGEFCLMRRCVVDAINAMPERQRFIRGLRAWCGFRQIGIPYTRDAREEGATKFNFGAMITLALDGLLAYSTLPLRLMFFVGAAVTMISIVISLLNAGAWLLAHLGFGNRLGVLPPGLTQMNLIFTTLLGLNILGLGVVAEYVGRIYEETKQRPLFLVRSILRAAPRGAAAQTGPAGATGKEYLVAKNS